MVSEIAASRLVQLLLVWAFAINSGLVFGAEAELEVPVFNPCWSLLDSVAEARIDTGNFARDSVRKSNGLGVGLTHRTYHTGNSRGGFDTHYTRWSPADIILLSHGGSEARVPVQIKMARVGLFAELVRFNFRLRFHVGRTERRTVKELMGTYTGIDASLMFFMGFYGAIARNRHGVTLTHYTQGWTHKTLLGLIGAGIAIPMITIKPDYHEKPADHPLWDAVVNW